MFLSPASSLLSVSGPFPLSAHRVHYLNLQMIPLGLYVRCCWVCFVLGVLFSFEDTHFRQFKWQVHDGAEDGERQDCDTVPRAGVFYPVSCSFLQKGCLSPEMALAVMSHLTSLSPNLLICQWGSRVLPCLSHVAAARSKQDNVCDRVSEVLIKN